MTVAALPWGHGMPAGQGKSDRRMIEFGAHPTVNAVASLTGGRELRGDVVGSGRLLEISRVA
jgi:hypothetical protein